MAAAQLSERAASDHLAPFRPLVTGMRWAALAIGAVLAATDIAEHDWARIAWLVVLIAYTTWRTLSPIVYRPGDVRSTVRVVFEVGLCVGAVMGTGFWDSPYVFSLLTAIIIAGFAQGFALALRTAVTAIVAISLPLVLTGDNHADRARNAAQWSMELLLVALVAGYGRRLSGEAEQRTELALDRMSRLAEANALLFSLHRVAQALPASLDLGEALDSTMTRLRDLIGFGTAVILMRDDSTSSWLVAGSDGIRLPQAAFTDNSLPRPLRRASHSLSSIAVEDLTDGDGPGLNPMARCGIYAPLRARGALVALVGLEHGDPGRFGPRDLEVLDGLAEPAALAIDNARWFNRLRTVGADEERTRIARDLHDRIGQSLAYLAFELDRISKRAERDEPVHAELQSLREDVRKVVSEVRETLYDLRTDVSEQQDLVRTLELYLERVGERAGLEVRFEHWDTGRLPLPQERELWRIAQEAVANVERHAGAHSLRLRWSCDGASAVLEVSDDGKGFPVGSATRVDAYGMLGMRERADAIGAHLEIESAPGAGTRVRCVLGDR